MKNSPIFDIPLITKFWDIDYGTYSALPINCRISKVFVDEDGEFTVYCTKVKDKHLDDYANLFIEIANPSTKFDYYITAIEQNDVNLNEPFILRNWLVKNKKSSESYRIFISFFLYNKISDLQYRQKVREHVRNEYNYNPSLKSNLNLTPVLDEPQKDITMKSVRTAVPMKFEVLCGKFIPDKKDKMAKSVNVQYLDSVNKNENFEPTARSPLSAENENVVATKILDDKTGETESPQPLEFQFSSTKCLNCSHTEIGTVFKKCSKHCSKPSSNQSGSYSNLNIFDSENNHIKYKFNENGKIVEDTVDLASDEKINSDNNTAIKPISDEDVQPFPSPQNDIHKNGHSENLATTIIAMTKLMDNTVPSKESSFAQQTNNTLQTPLLKVNENGQMPFLTNAQTEDETTKIATDETEASENTVDVDNFVY